MNHSKRYSALALVFTLGLAACNSELGSGEPTPGGGGAGGVGSCDPSTQSEALDCLGVARDESPRVSRAGAELPPSYAPLGTSMAVGTSREFFMIGMQLAPPTPIGAAPPLDERTATVAFADDTTHAVGPAIVALGAAARWETDTHSSQPGFGGWGAESVRAAAAADFDGNGKDELVVAWLDFDDPVNAGSVFVTRADGGSAQVVATVAGARDVVLERGDFDGDGRDELALGVASDAMAQVFIVRYTDGVFEVVEGATRTVMRAIADATLSVELATGNIDRDGGEELAMVVNEHSSTAGAQARYSLVDDASHSYALLADAQAIVASDGPTRSAVVADVSLGDIDGDGEDEIVFAGLTEFPDESCRAYEHIYLALDDAGDAPAPLAVIGEKLESQQYLPSSGCSEDSHLLKVRHVFVNTLDIDGDGVDEVQANLRVFEDFREAAFEEAFAIDPVALAGPDGYGGGFISPGTMQMAAGDVNGDGRDDIVMFAQHMDEVVVWGIEGPDSTTAQFREMTALPTASYNQQSRVFPLIVPANVDDDGLVLKYTEAKHELVFTQPIIMAAIAAAPCAEGIGQNVAACTTAYGLSEAQTGGIDASISVRASVFTTFEAKDPFFGIGVEGKASVNVEASFSAAFSYNLEQTVEYTTGSIEDTVVFTTVPLDRYRYTIVAHPDPTLVGTEVVVNLPREPVTLQVERSFYNANVVDGGFRVEDNVFHHAAGDIDSYPTEAQADSLIASGGRDFWLDLGGAVDHLLGKGLKANKPITVGQGSGQTSTEISFTTASDYRGGLEVGFDVELATTGPAGFGGSVGGSLGAGVSWGTSNTTTYRGTIGSIDAEHFADHDYSVGLFTYLYNGGDSGAQQFEVVNYWVTR